MMVLRWKRVARYGRNFAAALRTSVNAGVRSVGGRVKKLVIRSLIRVRQEITVLIFGHLASFFGC